MAKKLIINAIEPREIRAAIVVDDQPQNFFVERSTRKYQKGNIYRARVTSIEPHLQAAFVELEKGQHGFLSLSDVIFPDGGISLMNGLPEPPMPEIAKKDGDKKHVDSGKQQEKEKPKSALPEGQKEGKKESESESQDESSFTFFDDTPEHPVPSGPKPPITELSDVAGDFLLNLETPAEHNPIVETERPPEEEPQPEASEASTEEAPDQTCEKEPKTEDAEANATKDHEGDADLDAKSDSENNGTSQVEAATQNLKIPEPKIEVSESPSEAPTQEVEDKKEETKANGDKEQASVSENQPDHEPENSLENSGEFEEQDPGIETCVDTAIFEMEDNDESEAEQPAHEGQDQAAQEEKVEADTSSTNTEENSSPSQSISKNQNQEESGDRGESAEEAEDKSEDSLVDIDDIDDSDDGAEMDGDDDGVSDGDGSEQRQIRKAKRDNRHQGRKGGKHRPATLRRRRPNLRIEDVLQIGQYITVQITKEGIGNKAPMVTTFISLAGHYMVLTPGGDRSGVSRQVRTQQERSRLRTFIEKSEIPERCGLIVRTAAEGVEQKDLELDIQNLSGKWDDIQKQYRRMNRSGIIRKEEDLTTRLVRDYYNQDIDEVWIDDPKSYQDIREFFESGMGDQVDRVKLYEGDRPIFYHHNLESPLGELFRRRVNLPGGGSLIFDQGEAMLVIDINSGTFKEGTDDEDTAFRLNMLACQELARQIQMRDVGGIIMIDFVDMRRISSRNKVERELEKCFKGDKAKINIMSIGALGVLQMSRQRTKDSLRGSLYSSCSHCEGTGLIPSQTHSAMGILREIRGNIKRFNGGTLKVATTSDIAVDILNNYRSELVKMEEEENSQIVIDIDPSLKIGQFKLTSKGQQQRPNNKKNFRSDEDRTERPNKKKKKRKEKIEKEQESHVGSTTRLEKLEKKFPSEPLGIIKAPAAAEAQGDQPKDEQVKESPDSASQDSKGISTEPTLKAEKTNGDASESNKKTVAKAQKEEKQDPSTEPSAKPAIETSSEEDDGAKKKRTKRLYKGAKGSARNPGAKKPKKSKAEDLKKKDSDKTTPPANEAE
jgi:ribonuclease E